MELKFDPVSQVTGAALVRKVDQGTAESGSDVAVVGLFELVHQGEQIKKKMEPLQKYRRRSSSNNLRYRKAMSLNQKNMKKDTLATKHREDQVVNFAKKIQKLALVTSLDLELVRKGPRL